MQQIARRAAADLQHRAAGRNIQLADYHITAQQIGFAGHVIDVALEAIDRVHVCCVRHAASFT